MEIWVWLFGDGVQGKERLPLLSSMWYSLAARCLPQRSFRHALTSFVVAIPRLLVAPLSFDRVRFLCRPVAARSHPPQQLPRPRGLTPNSSAAFTCVMCLHLSTFNRSRSLLDIHSSSCRSAMPYQSGTFYLAPRGTSHVAATRWNSALPRQLPYDIISAKLRRLPESALRVELGIGPLALYR